MAARAWERRTTRAAPLSRMLAWFAAVLFIVALASHRFGLLETVGFLWVLTVAGAVALLALVLAAYAFARVWSRGDLGGRDLTVGAAVALVVLVPYAYAAVQMVRLPWVVDVSTDPEDPPAITAVRSADMNPLSVPDPQAFAGQAASYPGLSSRPYAAPPETVASAVMRLAEARGWQPAAAILPGQILVEALAHDPVLALPSDVSLRIVDAEEGSLVDMRSASRYGPHDLGDNARRIVAFLGELDDAMADPSAAGEAD